MFEAANGGTVLLDEIGELASSAQAALLRVLETKRFSRVGSSQEIEVDVRVIAATHRDLSAMCDAGEFRTDLLYRLDAMTITIPPLRNRAGDLEPLCQRFIKQVAKLSERPLMTIHHDAMRLLRQHHWPGNVRELRNAIDRAVAIAEEDVVTPDDLPERIRELAPPGDRPPAPPITLIHPEGCVDDSSGLRQRVELFESELIMEALRQCDWDRRKAAERLDLPLSTLAHKMRAHGIKRVS